MKKVISAVVLASSLSMAATYEPELSYYINPKEHPGDYAYAAATVYYDSVFHQFFCSLGMGTDSTFFHPDPVGYYNKPVEQETRDKYHFGFWDFIRYHTSKNGYNWTNPRLALTPTVTTSDKSETCTCDPAIIKHGSYWYLYYTGARPGYETVVYVARSKYLNGPFDRYTKRGNKVTWERWPADPTPILYPKQNVKSSYGLGQLSVVKLKGIFHFWFNYVVDGKKQNFMHMTSSSPYSDLQSKTWTAISLDGKKDFNNRYKEDGTLDKNTQATDEFNDFGEVRWNTATERFELWTTSTYYDNGSKGKDMYLVQYESKDGNTWTSTGQKIGPYNYMHNVGISGDENGHVNGKYIITFSAPTNSQKKPLASSPEKPWSLFEVMVGDNKTYPLAVSNGFQFPLPFPSTKVEAVQGDFDGDGIADLGVVDWDTPDPKGLSSDIGSTWYIISSKTGRKGTPFVPWGFWWQGMYSQLHTIVSGDYDGDGKTDLAVVDKANGLWYIISSKTGQFLKNAKGEQIWGWKYNNMNSSSIPLSGDYDGDGKADIGFVNPSTGKWYIKASSTGKDFVFGTETFNGWQWNNMNSSHIPVEGDFDGDGKTNLAIYNKNNGAWSIISSQSQDFLRYHYHSNWTDYRFFGSYTWGGSIYKPVVGNYDNDGKDDLSLVCPSQKIWIYKDWDEKDHNINFPEMTNNSQFLTGDYDGDGKSDEVVFNKSNRKFYIHSSLKNTIGYSGITAKSLYSFETTKYLAKSAVIDNDVKQISLPERGDLKVAYNKSSIEVSGLMPGQKVSVFNMKGQKVFEEQALSSDMSFTMPTKGMYILKTQDRVINFMAK